ETLIKSLAKPGTSVALTIAGAEGLLGTAGKNSVRLWRTSDWVETVSLTNHTAPIAFSVDGHQLAANSPGGIRVIDSPTGKLNATIPNSMPPFAFSPTGNVIAVDT